MEIALAIIRHPTEDLILIAQRRSDAHLANLWEFPGGKCQSGESLWECAARETLEEVDLSVTLLEEWPAVRYAYPERTVTLHPFLCQAKSSKARSLGNKQVAWVAPKELGNYPFPEANVPIITQLLAR